MKKKFFLYGAITASIGLNLYFINSEIRVVDTLGEELVESDDIKVAQSAIKKPIINLPKENSKNIDNIRKQILSPDESSSPAREENFKEDISNSEYEREYEKAKGQWQEDMRSYLERDIGIPSEYVDEYFEMAGERDREISGIMQAYFEDNDNQDEAYIYTVEDNIHLAKINKKYLDRLKGLLGEDSYKDYVKYRNESVKKMIQSGSGFMVEF